MVGVIKGGSGVKSTSGVWLKLTAIIVAHLLMLLLGYCLLGIRIIPVPESYGAVVIVTFCCGIVALLFYTISYTDKLLLRIESTGYVLRANTIIYWLRLIFNIYVGIGFFVFGAASSLTFGNVINTLSRRIFSSHDYAASALIAVIIMLISFICYPIIVTFLIEKNKKSISAQ